MWSRGSQGRWERAAPPPTTAGSMPATPHLRGSRRMLPAWPHSRTAVPPKACMKTASSCKRSLAVWGPSRNTQLLCMEQEYFPSFSTCPAKLHVCEPGRQRNNWSGAAGSSYKHLHHWMALGSISRAIWDGSQGNLSGYSGRRKEVYQQWWIVGTETSISPPCLPAQLSNKILLFTTAQGQPSPPPMARKTFVP